MRLLLKILLLLLFPAFALSQTRRQIDSAYLILQQAVNDTVRMNACSMLGEFYDDVSIDSGLFYCNKGIAIAEKLDLQLNKAKMLAIMGWPLMKEGNYPKALRVISLGLKIAENPSNKKKIGMLPKGQSPEIYQRRVVGLLYAALEFLYFYVGNYEKQIVVAHEASSRLESAGDKVNLAGVYTDIGDSYLKLNNTDSALHYQQQALKYYSTFGFEDRKFEGGTYSSLGMIYKQIGNMNLASENYQKAVQVSVQHGNLRHTGDAYLQLANLYQSSKKTDSGFLYAKKALEAFSMGGYRKEEATAYRMISDYYHDQSNTDSSFVYLRNATFLNDSLSRIEKARLQEFQVAAFNQQLELQQQEQARIEKEGRQKTIAIIALIAVFGTIGFLLYRNNLQKQKANHILEEKNSQIEQTLADLKSTQAQLIQSEKMASLGELTAGIAHEIQNPLNFVNNFSELNKELIYELIEEVEKGNIEEVKLMASDLKGNSEKINHHGQRAADIVKGMLQHSRSSTGQKELTDINALCDEYLRLSYHGLRAKDKTFNAKFETSFDESIGKVNIVPQELGRGILNLINNAFYAVSAKALAMADSNYIPTVTVKTSKNSPLLGRGVGGEVEISIKDNGSGIPSSIKDKIFQPFFTTKPTGSGTGLGLSLSYDIVKAHGGEIKVTSKENEGTEFIIRLPVV